MGICLRSYSVGRLTSLRDDEVHEEALVHVMEHQLLLEGGQSNLLHLAGARGVLLLGRDSLALVSLDA